MHPIGTPYGIWVDIDTFGAIVFGMMFLDKSVNAERVVFTRPIGGVHYRIETHRVLNCSASTGWSIIPRRELSRLRVIDRNFQGFGRFLTGSTSEYYFRIIKSVV